LWVKVRRSTLRSLISGPTIGRWCELALGLQLTVDRCLQFALVVALALEFVDGPVNLVQSDGHAPRRQDLGQATSVRWALDHVAQAGHLGVGDSHALPTDPSPTKRNTFAAVWKGERRERHGSAGAPSECPTVWPSEPPPLPLPSPSLLLLPCRIRLLHASSSSFRVLLPLLPGRA